MVLMVQKASHQCLYYETVQYILILLTRLNVLSFVFIIFLAYLSRGDYNVFTVDWQPLSRFPCYLSSLSNTRLVAQCTSQLYAYIMDMGGTADKTTCVGHSLGAHICGMISNHLTRKQYKIVGKLHEFQNLKQPLDRFKSKMK